MSLRIGDTAPTSRQRQRLVPSNFTTGLEPTGGSSSATRPLLPPCAQQGWFAPRNWPNRLHPVAEVDRDGEIIAPDFAPQGN